MNSILQGRAVLSKDEEEALYRNTKNLGRAHVMEKVGLRLETLLAIERVLTVHAENIKKLGGGAYHDKIDASQEFVLSADLITEAYRVYQQGEVKRNVFELQLPQVVNIEEAIKQNKRQQQVQEIVDMIDATDHLIYTEAFVNWLEKLDDDLFELVRGMLLGHHRFEGYKEMSVEGIIEHHDTKELTTLTPLYLMEAKFPKLSDADETQRKLRFYFLEYLEAVGHYEGSAIVLIDGSTTETQQNPTIDKIETAGTDKKIVSDRDVEDKGGLTAEEKEKWWQWLYGEIKRSRKAKEKRQKKLVG